MEARQQYDFENYQEALLSFEKMEELTKKENNREMQALALIWQGHMLDLLEKREEAISCYKHVGDMNITDQWAHSQFGLRYEVSAYANERIRKPFQRIENQDKE